MAPHNCRQWKIQSEAETREQSVTELRLKTNFYRLDIFPAGDESVSRIKPFWGYCRKKSELNPHETFWVHQAKNINQSTVILWRMVSALNLKTLESPNHYEPPEAESHAELQVSVLQKQQVELACIQLPGCFLGKFINILMGWKAWRFNGMTFWSGGKC